MTLVNDLSLDITISLNSNSKLYDLRVDHESYDLFDDLERAQKIGELLLQKELDRVSSQVV